METPEYLIGSHYDDVVISVIHALRRGSTIVTIMGGAPEKRPADSWNQKTTGKKLAQDALAVRIDEDDAVVNALGVRAVRLGYWDFPYLEGEPRDKEPIVRELSGILAEAVIVYAPLGLRHEDHIDTSDATFEALERSGFFEDGGELRLYQDTPYGYEYPGIREERLTELHRRGFILTAEPPVRLTPDAVQRKSDILNLYASQTPHLRERFPNFKEAIATEQIWRVEL